MSVFIIAEVGINHNGSIDLAKKFTILYVEDDENIRTQMQKLFEKIFKKNCEY